jgi:catechol 2,3-dioxygenase-like lactoylglutathione lyase family enzyme
MTVSSLHHVAIRVQDPDRSRAFYERVLGLAFLELPVGTEMTGIWRGAPSEGTLLAAQAGDTFVILEPPLEGTPEDDRFNERRIGVDHLAFGVDDPATLDELGRTPARRRFRDDRRRARQCARQGLRRLPRPRQRAVGVLHAVGTVPELRRIAQPESGGYVRKLSGRARIRRAKGGTGCSLRSTFPSGT